MKTIVLLFLGAWVVGCSSSKPSAVLDPVEVSQETSKLTTGENADAQPEPPVGASSEAVGALTAAQPSPSPSEAPKSAAFLKLNSLLQSLGYEAVGLEYETDATLELLHKVFANPLAAGRRVSRVYTGKRLAYDKAKRALTVGGTQDPQEMLAFIKKLPGKAKKSVPKK